MPPAIAILGVLYAYCQFYARFPCTLARRYDADAAAYTERAYADAFDAFIACNHNFADSRCRLLPFS